MQRVNLVLPVYLPNRVFRILRGLRRRLSPKSIQNLLGDRDVEWSFCAANMPNGPGESLDFGCGGSYMGLVAARRGFRVTAVDLSRVSWPYSHPNLSFIQGDVLTLDLPKRHYDLVINCSSVEHVGLVGRYGVTEERPDGDLETMVLLNGLMKPGGIMLLTVPVGQDAVLAPLHRVYGRNRLPRLLTEYVIEYNEFWVKDVKNRWAACDKATALESVAYTNERDPLQSSYALGCFVLRKPEHETPVTV